MLRAGNCTTKILGADAVKNKLKARVGTVEDEHTKLFAKQALTVALSLDGWTS
jgi:hypothetical protein